MGNQPPPVRSLIENQKRQSRGTGNRSAKTRQRSDKRSGEPDAELTRCLCILVARGWTESEILSWPIDKFQWILKKSQQQHATELLEQTINLRAAMATEDGFKKYTQQLRAWDKGQKEQAKEGLANLIAQGVAKKL